MAKTTDEQVERLARAIDGVLRSPETTALADPHLRTPAHVPWDNCSVAVQRSRVVQIRAMLVALNCVSPAGEVFVPDVKFVLGFLREGMDVGLTPLDCARCENALTGGSDGE